MPTSRRRHASTTRAQALARRANVKRRVPTGLSAEGSAARKIEDALLEMYRLAVEADPGTKTNNRFLYYELVSARVIEKDALGKRTNSNKVIAANTRLRELGLIPWNYIVDETRELTDWQTDSSVAEGVLAAVNRISLHRWGRGNDGAPLVICESRSLMGVLERIASRYTIPITSTNGQARAGT